MAEVSKPELVELTEKFFTAYNDMDLDTFGSLLTDDVHWEHHNRFQGSGREPLVQSVRDIHAKLPDRRFGPLIRWAVNGNVVHCEHQWFGTPAVDEEEWNWKVGVPTSMDGASVLVFEDGRIAEWSDYA